MEMQIKIDDQAVQADIRARRRRLANLQPVMSLVGQYGAEEIDKNFEAEGRPDKWQALSAITLKGKKSGLKILEGESGDLRDTIHVEPATSNSVSIAPDDLPYARIQQLGGDFSIVSSHRRVTIPARPYLVLDGDAEKHIELMIMEFIIGES